MSKVLVDREEIEAVRNTLANGGGAVGVLRWAESVLAAQPAEAEGVSNARLMNTLAELARRAPLRTLHTICETQRQVSTVKLERYLGPVGDTLAGYAFTLRNDFDKLSAALSAVTAERDRLREQLDALSWENASPNISYALRDQLLGQLAGDHEPEEILCVEDFYSWLANAIDNIRAEHRKAEGGQPVRVFASAAMAAKEA